MSRRRVLYTAVFVALALTAGIWVSNQDSQATTFRPGGGSVILSDETLGANADIVINYTVNAPDAQFAGVVLTFNSPEFVTSPVTLGKTVGYLEAPTVNLSLANSACDQSVPVAFRLVEASTDNSSANSVPPVGLSQDRLLSWIQDDGDIDNDTIVDDASRAGNGIADGAEWYPDFLNGLFANQQPSHRYFGWELVPGTPVHAVIQIVMFEPGDLLNLPSIPSSELLTADRGTPSFVALNDPTAALSQGIDEFCTPLGTKTTLCGQTDDDPDAPLSVPPDCDVGASSEVVRTNPTSAGTYGLGTFTMSLRDVDNDGIENMLDPCPYNFDTWDPRLPTNDPGYFGDADKDGIPDTCDTVNDPLSHDHDNDNWRNRIDNCPKVANGAEPMTTPNQKQNDMDIVDLTIPVPDGGPRADQIGPECDANPTSPDGHYHVGVAAGHRCLSGTDSDADDVCADYPGENDGTDDTDTDGVLDTLDNCIGYANPHPTGLTQMSPDLNGNGVVQIDDVTYVAGRFGLATGQDGYRAAAELANQNGIIQIDDVMAAAAAFGRNC